MNIPGAFATWFVPTLVKGLLSGGKVEGGGPGIQGGNVYPWESGYREAGGGRGFGSVPVSLPGRAGLGSDLQSAAESEMEAVRTNVGMQLSQALRRSDITMAQRGMLRSGEAIQGRQTLEQAAMRDVATASAGIQLEKMGLQQQAQQAQRTYDLQVAQLESGRKMAESAMYQQMATLGIQLALQNPDFLSSLFGGGGEEELYTNPAMTSILEAYQ